MEDDFDDLAYLRGQVSALIEGGFFNEDDLETYIADLAFDPASAPYAGAVRDHARGAMAAKRSAEAGWPDMTDCDRIDRAFAALEAGGILALHNAGVTTSDAHSDAWDTIGRASGGSWRGFAFYHQQDVESALAGHGLHVGFDAVAEGPAAKQAIGDAIVAALTAQALAPRWDRDPEIRILVPGFLWQRRTRWARPLAAQAPVFLRRLPG